MSRIEFQIEETELENDSGRMIPGVIARCSECDHETESYGTGENSRKRCLVLMREECPCGDDNFYVDSDE
jgi:hypothetical protein